mgnify:CR=1 FL=1
MKILHTGYMHYIPGSIKQQLESELTMSVGLANSVEWDVAFFSNDLISLGDWHHKLNAYGRAIDYFNLRIRFYYWLFRVSKDYDCVLLRWPAGDLFTLLLILLNNNIYTIHHTFEIKEVSLRKGRIGKLKSFIEKHLSVSSLKKARGIIGVTGEIVDYELNRVSQIKPTFVYPNGFDISSREITIDKRNGAPVFLMIATEFSPWQGLELVIDELKVISELFEFHVIGNVSDSQIKRGNGDERFVFHGMRDSGFINEVMGKVDVGIAAYRLDLKGMKQACSLKVRDYLAAGVPVYSGHADATIPDNFPYYINKELNPHELIDFAKQVRSVPRQKVREESEKYIDKRIYFKALTDWLLVNQ